jgi:hypothetical protein
MWWLNTDRAQMKGVSPAIYYALGFGGNYIIVDKEHDLLVVTRWMDDARIGDVVALIIKSIEDK